MPEGKMIDDGQGGMELHIPDDPRIAALVADVAALKAELAKPERMARTGAAFEAFLLKAVESQQAALAEFMERAATVGEKLVKVLGDLAAKDIAPVVNVSPTFSPVVQPAPAGAVNVIAQVQLPPPRQRVIEVKVDDQGNAKGTVN